MLKSVSVKSTALLLIISQSVEERRLVRDRFFGLHSPRLFSSVDVGIFLNEIQSLELFTSQRSVCLTEVEKLSKVQLEAVLQACRHLPSDLKVCLEASSLKGEWASKIEQMGRVVRIADAKPWEKNDRMVAAIIDKGASQGITISVEVARVLWEALGYKFDWIESELDKLICYLGDRRELSLEDIRAVTPLVPQHTLWQLADTLYACEQMNALRILAVLLNEQVSPLAILATLRTQTQNNLRILQLSSHGANAVSAEFPYLKGRLYDKKIELLRKYGVNRLMQLMEDLFEAEWGLKNHPLYPQYPLERLIIRAT